MLYQLIIGIEFKTRRQTILSDEIKPYCESLTEISLIKKTKQNIVVLETFIVCSILLLLWSEDFSLIQSGFLDKKVQLKDPLKTWRFQYLSA